MATLVLFMHLCLLGTAYSWSRMTRQLHPPQCTSNFDVVLIVEKSSRFDEVGFMYCKEGLQVLVDAFTVSANRSHIGAVLFDTEAQVHFLLDQFTDKESVKDAIANFPNPRGHSNMYAGLRVAREVFLNVENETMGDRPNVDNLCFLLADGLPNVQSRVGTILEAERLKRYCTLIIIYFEVTTESRPLMEQLATDRKAVPAYAPAMLVSQIDNMIYLACPQNGTVTVAP